MKNERAEGIAEGKAKGLAKGRAEGRAEGIAEGLAKAAKRMLAIGIPVEQISLATGLSVNEIMTIKP